MKKNLCMVIALFFMLAMTGNATNRDHLAPTPPMGWMTWNMFKGDFNEELIRKVADYMVEEGFLEAGYNYIFIDDLWQGGRDKRNNIIPDPKKFPSGIKALADYVHNKGLKLGIYSDAAPLTCAGVTGSLGFEEQDAKTVRTFWRNSPRSEERKKAAALVTDPPQVWMAIFASASEPPTFCTRIKIFNTKNNFPSF